jgi:acyl carrier protein
MFEQLREIISQKFQVDPADIAPDSKLQDMELDSLDLVELSLVIEKELGARVSDTELADLQQLDAIVQLVEGRNAPA